MSVSAISSAVPAAALQEVSHAAPAPTSTKPAAATLSADTVSLSPAAQKASQTGDVDHDGDSH
jgi:hypothetical protein